jgi:DICT domain-containing protein
MRETRPIVHDLQRWPDQADQDLDSNVATSESWLTRAQLIGSTTAIKAAFVSAVARGLLHDPTRADGPPLVIALFQDGAAFAAESSRYASFAAIGSTVIVGFPGAENEPAAGVTGVDTRHRDELADAWALVVVHPLFAATLLGVEVPEDERPDGGRLFAARRSLRLDESLVAATQLLRPLRAQLPAPIFAVASATIRRAEESIELMGGDDTETEDPTGGERSSAAEA